MSIELARGGVASSQPDRLGDSRAVRASRLSPLSAIRSMQAALGSHVTRQRVVKDLAVAGLGGWLVGLIMLLQETGGRLAVGYDLAAYIRAGHDLLSGAPVYVGHIGQSGAFSYAPPWAVLFAAIAWIPGQLVQLAMMVLDLLALRYLFGRWSLVGLAFLCPWTVSLIITGNVELLIAAGILGAARGHAAPLALMAMTKLSPILAMPRTQWLRAALAVLAICALSLPWLHLWPEWISYLLQQPSAVPGLTLGPPWYVRLPLAIALLAIRRPWSSALAAVVAWPAMWMGTLFVLLAPARIWLDTRLAASR